MYNEEWFGSKECKDRLILYYVNEYQIYELYISNLPYFGIINDLSTKAISYHNVSLGKYWRYILFFLFRSIMFKYPSYDKQATILWFKGNTLFRFKYKIYFHINSSDTWISYF